MSSCELALDKCFDRNYGRKAMLGQISSSRAMRKVAGRWFLSLFSFAQSTLFILDLRRAECLLGLERKIWDYPACLDNEMEKRL